MDNKAIIGQKIYNGLKKIMLVLWALVVILVVVIIIKNKQVPKRENLTLDEFVALTTMTELGKTNKGKERFVSSDEVDGYKRVFLNMDNRYDNIYQVEESVSQVINVLSILSKDEEFYNTDFQGMSFQWLITVIDKYGTESEEVGCIITIDKKELHKIKWEDVTREGFVEVAKTFWVHDVLIK